MDNIAFYQKTLEKIFNEYAAIPYSHGEINQYVIIDNNRTHFLLINEGWSPKKRIHGCLVHAEIRNHKIWIHCDGLEDGITDALVAAGITKDKIVLAFQPPHLRPHTGYAVA